jgi:hypothetical protein
MVVHIANFTSVVIQNNKLFVNGTEYFIKGVDYNPTPLGIASMGSDGYGGGGYCSAKMTPWGEWKSACYDSDYFDGGADYYTRWPPAPEDGFAALWRRDFPVIKAMGANTLRIYNTNPTTRQMSELYPTNFIPFPQGKDHIPFLDMAQQYGFYVIFPLYSDLTAFTDDSETDFKRLLRAQIDEVGNHSSLLIWQFGNEMNWDGVHLGFYPYPDLMAKYNNYAAYIRQYTLSKWGRKIPITHAVVDYDTTFDWLMQRFDTDIFSLNSFRGTTTTTLFPGDSNTVGFTYGTCAWNKPLIITEFGWDSYTAGWANKLISDFVSHINQGLIGVVLFEHNDEPQKSSGQRFFGASSVAVTYNGTQNSTQPNVFLADTIVTKQLYTDISGGKYNNTAYNYHSNFYTLAGRSVQVLGSSIDYCTSQGTFYNCPGGNPMCSGHGICDRMTGLCSCTAGWNGSDCATPTCYCSGRGSCSIVTSPPQCVCNHGFYGASCERVFQVKGRIGCANNCTENANGICNSSKLCDCVSGWSGLDCSVVSIPNPFPGMGVSKILYPSMPLLCVGPIGEGKVLSVTCPSSQVISSVQFASFGTPKGSCGSLAKGSCDASSSLSVFESNCMGKNRCSFNVSDKIFGDPCVGIGKSFYAQYTCASSPSTLCTNGSEGAILLLTCPSHQVISEVTFASYGTPTGSCGFFATGSCYAISAVSVFETKCLNATFCSFIIGNTAFGDPCPGTAKHFDAQVTCA